MSDNFALELFSGIGGMSLGLHSAGFETHGFDASERAVAMANENGLAATAVDVFDPDTSKRCAVYTQAPSWFIVRPRAVDTVKRAQVINHRSKCGTA